MANICSLHNIRQHIYASPNVHRLTKPPKLMSNTQTAKTRKVLDYLLML